MLFHFKEFQVPVVLKDNRRRQASGLSGKAEVRARTSGGIVDMCA